MIDAQFRHAMFPEPNHDELARQSFVNDFRMYMAGKVAPGTKAVYNARVVPAFEKEHGRPPKDRHEVRKLMTHDPFYQMWSACQRNSQEMVWDTVIDSVERQWPDLIARAKEFDAGNPKGSLRLNPEMPIPRYHSVADIHLQPGGYHTDFTEDDVAAGAVYERGVYLYIMGGVGPKNDYLAQTLAKYVQKEYPDFKPQRILDLGCANGVSTLPWAENFPEAEVHGLDVGAPMLRYGHARAEAMGIPAHFSQQNAEETDFPDAHFDLVVSCILLHETSRKALPRIFQEAHRLLRPGGMMMHIEIPQDNTLDPYDSFMMEWEVDNNNETFLRQLRDMNFVEEAVKAGFDPDKSRMEFAPGNIVGEQKAYGTEEFVWPIVVATK